MSRGRENWARHLLRAREQQLRSGGFTELVPLPFMHMEAPMWLRGRARSGPTFGESLLMHAVARLALHPAITNIQASWVKLGPEGVAAALRAGVNDLGGTLMNESISRAAGSEHGQEMPPEAMEALIRANGRVPRQRTTLYGGCPRRAPCGVVRRGAARGAVESAGARLGPEGAAAARPSGAARAGTLRRRRRRRSVQRGAAGAIGTKNSRTGDASVTFAPRSSPHPLKGGGWEVGTARASASRKQDTAQPR